MDAAALERVYREEATRIRAALAARLEKNKKTNT